MNLNESELEDRLRALSPVVPSPALGVAIAKELKQSEVAAATRTPAAGVLPRPVAKSRAFPAFLRGLGWACAGACVAITAIIIAERSGEHRQSGPLANVEPAPAFDLAEASAEILAAEDEGLVYSDDEELSRRVRYSSIERRVWMNPSTGARLEIEIPREDIRLMPIALQ